MVKKMYYYFFFKRDFLGGPVVKGFPGGARGKEPTCQFKRLRFNPWVRKIPWRRAWQPTAALLLEESHRQGSYGS